MTTVAIIIFWTFVVFVVASAALWYKFNVIDPVDEEMIEGDDDDDELTIDRLAN